MAFIEDVQEAEPQVNARGDFLEEENEEENGQIIQPAQLAPTPVQENEIQEGEQETTAPPPPPQDPENNNGYTGNDHPSRYWCWKFPYF